MGAPPIQPFHGMFGPLPQWKLDIGFFASMRLTMQFHLAAIGLLAGLESAVRGRVCVACTT